jgi:hypothetical protein
LLLEDDAAVRVQSDGTLVSRALWAAKLVASDGRMNVPNERRSVESDEETFMDRHGRSLHLVGADVLHEQERPTVRCVMALPGLLNRALSARAVGDRSRRRAGSDSDSAGMYRHRMAAISRDLFAFRGMPFEALGMIETNGLIGAVEAPTLRRW